MSRYLFGLIKELQKTDPKASINAELMIIDGIEAINYVVFYIEECVVFTDLKDLDSYCHTGLTVDTLLAQGGL